MKPRRLVENVKSGDLWVETDPRDWEATLAAYLEAKDTRVAPCPAIRGHLMFKYPKDYGCKLVDACRLPRAEFEKLLAEAVNRA